jgi:hypothetical protein
VNRYHSDALSGQKVKTIAVLPIVVTAASTTKVAGSYSPQWIRETYTTTSLAPAEYQPAEQDYMRVLKASLPKVSFVEPDKVNRAMRQSPVATYDEAILATAKATGSDAVLSFRIRNLNQRAGSQIEGRPAAIGHADLTLFNSAGEPLWSVAGSLSYRQGNAVWSGPPPLYAFVRYALDSFQKDLRELNAKLQ